MRHESVEREAPPCANRRVSVPANRLTPKKKTEGGQHVVAKSELWDTGSQHRCGKSHQKSNRSSISQDEGIVYIEKSQHFHFIKLIYS